MAVGYLVLLVILLLVWCYALQMQIAGLQGRVDAHLDELRTQRRILTLRGIMTAPVADSEAE